MNAINSITQTNVDILRDLAEKSNDQVKHRTVMSAVFHAAAIALENFDEDDINDWDLNDYMSCGLNCYRDSATGEITWDASIYGDTENYTQCKLDDFSTAMEWYDMDNWIEEI